MNLGGKTALVTGAGRGIGRAIALALARDGCQVGIADILPGSAAAAAADVEALGVKGLALPVDLTSRAEVEGMVAETLAQFGQIDVLVNNAGWDRMGLFLDTDEDTWDRIIAVNLKAMLYVCKAVLPHMVARGAGKVVNVASDAGPRGLERGSRLLRDEGRRHRVLQGAGPRDGPAPDHRECRLPRAHRDAAAPVPPGPVPEDGEDPRGRDPRDPVRPGGDARGDRRGGRLLRLARGRTSSPARRYR